MLSNHSFRMFGIPPFSDRPVAAPSGQVDDDPQLGLTVSESWIPLITGCLKPLLSARTWDENEPGAADAPSEVDNLLSSWRPMIDRPPDTDWSFNPVYNDALILFEWVLHGVPGQVHPYGWAIYAVGFMNLLPPGIGAMTVGVEFLDDSLNQVGVNVYDFLFQSDNITDATRLSRLDCLDDWHYYDNGGKVVYQDVYGTDPNAPLKRLEWLCTGGMAVMLIKATDHWVCGPL